MPVEYCWRWCQADAQDFVLIAAGTANNIRIVLGHCRTYNETGQTQRAGYRELHGGIHFATRSTGIGTGTLVAEEQNEKNNSPTSEPQQVTPKSSKGDRVVMHDLFKVHRACERGKNYRKSRLTKGFVGDQTILRHGDAVLSILAESEPVQEHAFLWSSCFTEEDLADNHARFFQI